MVKRGYFEPDNERKRGDVRQPPENWESEVNPRAVKDVKLPNMPQPTVAPAAPSSAVPSPTAPSPVAPSSAAPSSTTCTASASGPSAVSAFPTPRSGAADPAAVRPLSMPGTSATSLPAIRRIAPGAGLVDRPSGNSIHEAIDISSDEEDAKPSLAELQRKSTSATSAAQRVEAQREVQNSAGNGADAQEDPFQDDPLRFDGPDESVHNCNRSTQAPIDHELPDIRSGVSEQAPQPQSLDIWTYITQFAGTPAPCPDDDDAITELLKLPRRREIPIGWRRRLRIFNTLSLDQLTAVILYLDGEASLNSPCIPMGCNLRVNVANCTDPDHAKGLCPSCLFAFPLCVMLPRHLFGSQAITRRLECYFCCNSYYRGMGMRLKVFIASSYVDDIAVLKTLKAEIPTQGSTTPRLEPRNAQLASSDSPAAQKQPLPEGSSVWDYIMSFSKTKIPIPDDEAITELLALRRLRELPKSWKYRLGAFNELDLKSYTAVILYLTGEEAHTSPCNVMGCNRNESVVEAAAELASRKDDGCWNRLNVKFAFPQCVFLPRHLLSSRALSKRLGIKTCCNAYYRIDKTADKASKERVMAALGRTETDGIANNRAGSSSSSRITTNSGSNNAKASNNFPNRSPFVSSAATAFTGLTIHTKPQTTPQQRNNKASSQRSSGIFCIPENTPGQMFSLKGTDTKIIQASRNQILKCKVLAGDGIKWQIVGGKEFRAYKGWNDEWEIPPDSQCLVKNIYPKKSFGENQTCIDVNPKKGAMKAT